MKGGAGALLAVLLALTVVAVPLPSHYLPHANDAFTYAETIVVDHGTGTYLGYSETSTVTGDITVTAVQPNGTDAADFANSVHFTNSTGANQHWSSSGAFTFSAVTFHYVSGTDNQTGYTNPLVWFYMNNSLGVGSTFFLLNSNFTVRSLDANYHLGTAAGVYVTTLYADGTGSYLRSDSYGTFQASYTWQVYFDPATGYIVGYLYTEHDASASASFDLTDTFGVTSTTYPLTAGTTPSSPLFTVSPLFVALVLILAVVVVVLVVALLLRSRRRAHLPRHSPTGAVTYTPPPLGPPPPPIELHPGDQPTIQQVVVKEVVKVNCRYCGSLIDSTAATCQFCGATRT